jgi:hypothetical protein
MNMQIAPGLFNSRIQAVLFAALLWTGCGSTSAFEIQVKTGPHPGGPVYWKPETPLPKEHKVALRNVKDGKLTPAQQDDQGRLWWWMQSAKENTEVSYEIVPALARTAAERVQVGEAKDGVIDITIDGKPFTSFNFKKNEVRPYLYPVIGPTGDAVTRDYPMKDTEEEKKKERQDHPHHRSIWTAHGEVLAGDSKEPTNYWAESADTGLQKVKRIVRTTSGPVFGEIEAEIEWTRRDGHRELTENRTYTFFCGDDNNRFIDVTVALHFPDSDVTFLDTKEGGMVAMRVATWMDETAGGHMTNSRNGKGMKECWGKPAEWCDYVGKRNDQLIGIAVMDAKTNYRHPAEWHIRDYGLYTANPFGTGMFTGDKSKNATKVWKKDENVTFNYRILIHKGDTEAAQVGEQYKIFSEPLEVTAK